MALRPLPHPSTPLVDNNGRMTQDWYLFFSSRQKLGLVDLIDVSASSPSNGDVLTYNSTSKKWEPA